jgi:hypothetical protein
VTVLFGERRAKAFVSSEDSSDGSLECAGVDRPPNAENERDYGAPRTRTITLRPKVEALFRESHGDGTAWKS